MRRALALVLAGLLAQPPAWAWKPGERLAPNTLPLNGVVRSGAALISMPAPAQMRIDQASQQAVIDWSSFNIGSAASVRFYQPGATAEALNRIFDADPTVIQGRLVANGRVYLVNQNGIVFDRGARVDVRGLLASSLDIPESVFQRGIFAGKLDQPAASGSLRLLLDAQGRALTDLEGEPLHNNVDNYGEIRSVDPDTGGSPGGFVMLIAPRVRNHGVIVANNGQVALAAGEKVYLSADSQYFTSYTPAQLAAPARDVDPFVNDRLSMRGMLVEVQAGAGPLDLSGIVANHGTLRAERGNVTLAALAVNQAGRVSAGSAVSQNGSVFLVARENPHASGAAPRSGRLVLAAGSVTEAPLIEDGTTLADGQHYWPYRSRLRLEGGAVHVQGTVSAAGGLLGVRSQDPQAPGTARVLLDAGSLVDVGGSSAAVPFERNLFTFRVTSDDLKDAPEQKGGFLLGRTVTVDLRKPDPLLFDLSAARANVRRSVAEKAASGGEITVLGDEVIAREGSVIDFSGGEWRFGGGRAATTWLTSRGRSYEISSAPAGLRYDGVAQGVYTVGHGRWGATERFVSPFALLGAYEAPYVEGTAGGSLRVDALALVLDGALRGAAIAGPRQVQAAALPVAGRVVLGDPTQAASDHPTFRLPGFEFAAGAVLPAGFRLSDPLPARAQARVLLAPDLLAGLTSLELYGNGEFRVPAGVAVRGAPGASLAAHAGNVRVEGDIRIPSGSVSLNARVGVAGVEVGPGATISTAGAWINRAAGGPLEAAVLDGGSLTLVGRGVALDAGSVLDVSGGALLSADGSLGAGDAGTLRLVASPLGSPATLGDFGALALGGELRGYSAGAKGGTLDLTAASALIGAGAPRNPLDLALDAGRFRHGGFGAYRITGHFDLEVAPGAVRPRVASRVIDAQRAQRAASGTDLAAFSTPQELASDRRPAASLTLRSRVEGAGAIGGLPGGLRVAAAALVETDPGASIVVQSRSALDIAGTLSAPAGSIVVSLTTDSGGAYGGGALRIARGAELLARGAFIDTSGTSGRRQGAVLAGGEVRLEALKNDLVVEAGAIVDVSGIAARLDLPQAGSALFARATLGSEGGLIAVRTTENARLDGTLAGRGAAGAAGGVLAIDHAYHGDTGTPNPVLADARHEIVLTQAGGSGLTPGARSVALAADGVSSGGFDRLRLASEDAIRFAGSTRLALAGALKLDTPEIAVADGAAIELSAGALALVNSPLANRPSTELPARVPVALRGGTGTFRADAELVDLAGHVVLNGVAGARLESRGDLRAAGFAAPFTPGGGESYVRETQRALSGSFSASGDLTLAAHQVYPASAVDFGVSAPGSRLRIERVAGAGDRVLSALGALRFGARDIEHAGTVLAPLGTLELEATSSLTLEAGSISSVSASGAVIPYGETVNGTSLFYGNVERSTGATGSRLSLAAPALSIASTAVVDLSGGGERRAVEFVPGIGGTRDVLLEPGTYALVPGLRFAPADAHYAGMADTGLGGERAPYDSVVLGAGSPLAAGRYALLPGYYALLPGAYVVRRDSSARDLPLGETLRRADGSIVVGGSLAVAASGAREARSSGFIVRPGAQVQREAEYRISRAAAPDAGHLSIRAASSLAFGGELRTAPAPGGRIAEVDIAAPLIAVVSQAAAAPAGYVALEAGALSGLGASLMLGATRASAGDGTLLDVLASRVQVLNDAAHPLASAEIILAARDEIVVAPTAVLRASGSAPGTPRDILLRGAADNGGALVRLSSGGQAAVRRGAVGGANLGALSIAADAELAASGSIALDATGETRALSALALAPGGALAIAANRVSLGGAPAGAGGIVVSDFGAFSQLGSLSLKSYSSLDLYGSVDVGSGSVASLVLDAPAFAGFGGAADSVRVQAATLVLQNTAGSVASPVLDAPANGSGSLRLEAGTLVLGEGARTISGFSRVTLAARGELVGRGGGTLDIAAETTLEAARIVGDGRSDQTVRVRDAAGNWLALRTARAADPLPGAAAPWGGRLALEGASIEHGASIELPAGEMRLAARGAAGDVVLADGATLAAPGFVTSISDEPVAVNAGRIVLSSDLGSIRAAAGALVDVSGGPGGGHAGELVLSAPRGTLRLDGALRASAAADYAKGSAAIDVRSLADFAQLDGRLNLGGFTERREYRVRTGSVVIPGADPFTLRPATRVVARELGIVADAGDITVGGVIDASGARGGGSVRLAAGRNLRLDAGSLIDARGTSAASGAADAYSHGGTVELAAIGGRLTFAPGSTVDVSASVAGKSDAGGVLFSAPRTVREDGTPGIDAVLAGRIGAGAGAGRTGARAVLEGARSYAASDTGAASVAGAGNPIWADFSAFAANAAAILADVRLTGIDAGAMRVRAGIELRSAGDLRAGAWNLTAWRVGNVAGRLALRAAGNLDIAGALGFANDSLPSGESWALRLVGGADLASADALAVVPSTAAGDVVLSQAASRVRTGTGSIEIAAGRDFRILNSSAVVYTAGTPSSPDTVFGVAVNRFASSGGDISIRAARDAVGPGDPPWVNDWLRRHTFGGFGLPQNGRWWTHRPTFRHHVGALAGGDVSIRAGSRVENLSAVVPTSGRVEMLAGETVLRVDGGGDLEVAAGGDIVGGDYLVGRGRGSLRSGGSIGAGNAVTLYLLGESDDAALRTAAFELQAKGGIALQGAANPTVLPHSTPSRPAGDTTALGFGTGTGVTFFTYAPDSRVSMVALEGDLVLGNRVEDRNAGVGARAYSSIFPAIVQAAALKGSIRGLAPFSTQATSDWRPFASERTRVQLLAAHDVRELVLEPGDAAAVPAWDTPITAIAIRATSNPVLEQLVYNDARQRRVQPAAAGELRYVLAAGSGDIAESLFDLPAPARIAAGRDLVNLRLNLQNLAASDETTVSAGRDVRYTDFTAAGEQVSAVHHAIVVAGPGRFVLRAGRDIDFGSAAGIDAVGNLLNSQLASAASADMLVMAGVSTAPRAAQVDALFAALKAAGLSRDAGAGDAAIASLFGAPHDAGGSVSMVQSAIRTRGGSAIDVLAPHGSIRVGLPTEQTVRTGPVNSEALQPGIVTGAGGGIRTLVRDDIDVNLSKLVTLLGGDILIYAQAGNIDAGRGPRDSVSSLAPQVERIMAAQPDGSPADSGLRRFRPPVDAAGSGIRTVSFDPDGPEGPIAKPEPGSIYLFAARGFIDAGEAGVSAAGNLVVVAPVVVNAANFSAGGTSSGVPVASVGLGGGALASASATSASTARASDDLMRGAGQAPAAPAFQPTFITVEVLGFGEAEPREKNRQ